MNYTINYKTVDQDLLVRAVDDEGHWIDTVRVQPSFSLSSVGTDPIIVYTLYTTGDYNGDSFEDLGEALTAARATLDELAKRVDPDITLVQS